MARAEQHARQVWLSAACEILQHFIDTREKFSAWEITATIRARKISTSTDRAIGPVFSHAEKCGMIEQTGEYAKNPLAHGCPSPIWRSLRYRKQR